MNWKTVLELARKRNRMDLADEWINIDSCRDTYTLGSLLSSAFAGIFSYAYVDMVPTPEATAEVIAIASNLGLNQTHVTKVLQIVTLGTYVPLILAVGMFISLAMFLREATICSRKMSRIESKLLEEERS